MLSVSEIGETESPTIPTDYDGSIGLSIKQQQRYIIAFKNAQHNVTPFVKKHLNTMLPLQFYKNNFMTSGIYYDVKVE